MDIVYIYEGDISKGKKGEWLIQRGAHAYAERTGNLCLSADEPVIREAGGKPFFADMPLFFSISHSGSMWVGLYCDTCCGIDLQVVKECNFISISRRYFSRHEQEWVEAGGLAAFFDIWVRKEALGKCTGKGVFADKFSCVSSGELLEKIEIGEKTFFFTELFIADDIKCVCCSYRKLDLEVSTL